MRQIFVELDQELARDAPPLDLTFVELSTVESWSELLRREMAGRDADSEIRSRLLGVAKLAITAVERIDESAIEEVNDFPSRLPS